MVQRKMTFKKSLGIPPRDAVLLRRSRHMVPRRRGDVAVSKQPSIAKTHPEIIKTLRASAAGVALACILNVMPQLAIAQQAGGESGADVPAFAPGMINHMQAMRRFKDPDRVFSRLRSSSRDSNRMRTRAVQSQRSSRAGRRSPQTMRSSRTSEPTEGPVSPAISRRTAGASARPSVADRFAASAGTDPIFRLVDGATCPSANVSTLQAKRQAYKLLTDKGLIRIGLPMPAPAILQFAVTSVNDPYQCTTNPATGLTSPTSGIVSVYRRPLPSANLGFLSTIMWDGREPSLASQADRCYAWPCAGQCRSKLCSAGRNRRIRKRRFHRAGLRQESGDTARGWRARRSCRACRCSSGSSSSA